MFALLKGMFKLTLFLFMLVAVSFLALDIYFMRFHHIDKLVLSAAELRYHEKAISPLSYSQIPVLFREAVIATEDRRFSTDPGIDPVGIIRSLIVDIQQGGYVQGGSTITQQVIDNTILQRQKTLMQKLFQAGYAVGLYDTMSKEDVFTIYSNSIYFGHGAYGLYNAAQTYFRKPPSQLNQGELTLLAGLPNSPSDYDPFRSMSLARMRQKIVLQNLVDNKILTSVTANQIYQEPIGILATSTQ